VPRDHLRVRRDPQAQGNLLGRDLHFYPWRAGPCLPVLLADLGQEGGTLPAAETAAWRRGERGDERVDLRYDEGALARPGLDQAQADELLDRIPDRVLDAP